MQTDTQKIASILYRTRKNEVQLIEQAFGDMRPPAVEKIYAEDKKLLRGLEEKFGCGKGKG